MTSQSDDATLRLTSADFDAYLPERATSNAHTEPRLALKERTLAWAKGVVTRLAELGISVQVTASDEYPTLRNGRRVDSQRVFFWRDTAARAEIERLVEKTRPLSDALADPAPQQLHPFLALRIDAAKVEVSVELHPDAWVDVRNLRAILVEPARTLELTSALEALPFQFTIGLSNDSERTPAADATSDRVRELASRAERENKALWIGWTIPRDVAVTHSELLDEQLEDAIVALGPIEKLIAWAPDNDCIDLAREPEVAKDERARGHEGPRDRAASQARRERVEQDERERKMDLAREASDEPPKQESIEATPPPPRVQTIRTVPRMMTRRPLVTEVDPSVPIEKGTRVQVLSGPFRGKVGVVQELDGRGGARVILGLLGTRVDAKELIAAAEGKDRPALASSHRKPMGVRS